MTNAAVAKTIGVLVVVACVPCGTASAQERVDLAAAEKGKVIYERYCASCHGLSGRGDGPVAPDLRVTPADLTRLAAKAGGRFPFEDVRRTIDGRNTPRAHGSSDMPVWGEVFQRASGTNSPDADSAILRLTHYLWSIQGK
jgi:mono/diheme cytochrome c family protein